MLEFFTEMQGRYRLIWGLGLLAINLILLFFVGIVWFWFWAVAVVILLSSIHGEF